MTPNVESPGCLEKIAAALEEAERVQAELEILESLWTRFQGRLPRGRELELFLGLCRARLLAARRRLRVVDLCLEHRAWSESTERPPVDHRRPTRPASPG
jgi:hypothetical protein